MTKQISLLEYLASKYSLNAIQGYKNQIKRYLLALGDQADQANEQAVLEYISQLRGLGLHPKSLRNNLFAIKIYYHYLLQTGVRNDHPCKYLNLKDPINKQIVVESLYSRDTLAKCYSTWQSKSLSNQTRDKIIVGLLIYQALTVQELVQLQIRDIQLDQASICVRSVGLCQERILHLKATQVLLLASYLQEQNRSSNDYLLLNKQGTSFWTGAINRIVNQNRNQNEKLLPLKIRQSVIAHLLQSNHDLRIVQEFAGHRRTSSTESYKQTGLDKLKTSIDKLHPLQ